MAMRNQKKGFVFTFLALFIVMLIYLFAEINIGNENYSQNNDFENARILQIDREIDYFKNSYLDDSVSISFDSTITSILNKSHEDNSFYKLYSNNYSKFNNFVYEGMINGSLNNDDIDNLENRTLNYLIGEFESSFEKNSRVNFNVSIEDVAIYERTPFHISVQLDYYLSVESIDELGRWKSNESITTQIALYEEYDPTHLLRFNLGSDSAKLENVENIYSSNLDWDVDLLNNTINEQLSSIYRESNYKYTIGSSFLNSLFNDTKGSYKNTQGFWSFDYDRDEDGVYDSSQNIEIGDYLGDSVLSMNFNDDSVSSPNIFDLSSYNNSGTINGGTNCNQRGIHNLSCSFDGSNDNIEIPHNESLNFDNEMSISLWINPNGIVSGEEILIQKENSWKLSLIESSGVNYLNFENPSAIPGDNQFILQDINISPSNWTNVIVNFDSGNVSFYVDSQDIETKENDNNIIEDSTSDVIIGGDGSGNDNYEGLIDELSIYSRALTKKEISRIYTSRQTDILGYVDSYHNQGAFFDGIDDEIKLNVGNNYSNFFDDDFSVEIWLKPYSGGGDIIDYPNMFKISYNDTNTNKIVLNDDNTVEKEIPLNLSSIYPNFILLSFNSTTNNISFYHNEKFISQKNWNPTSGSGGNQLIIGNSQTGNNYHGVIDEIRFRNETTKSSKVKRLYFNYGSVAKGCCNYILPINPEKTGFNTLSDKANISYSTNTFLKHHFDNENFNITLYNVTNITSNDVNEPHYNFLVDVCMINLYDIFAYDESGESAGFIKDGDDNGQCRELIDKGIY